MMQNFKSLPNSDNRIRQMIGKAKSKFTISPMESQQGVFNKFSVIFENKLSTMPDSGLTDM